MIGVAGLSHLGINTAAAFAAHGFDVVAYDDRAEIVTPLQRGQTAFFEPGLAELLAVNSTRLKPTTTVESLRDCEVVVFALDIATDDRGQSDTTALEHLIESVMTRAANEQTVYVLLSQVTPGFTRRLANRYRAQTPLWFYQVETLIFGAAVERAMKPERYMVGCRDPQQTLPEAFERLLQAFNCPIMPMRYESAELAKISINMYLTSSVSVTNMLAEVCEGIGADWSEIAPALRLDRRIGPYAYLSPGLGIAGGNLERDWATISRLSAEHGADASIVEAWRINSRHRRDWVLGELHDRVLRHSPAAPLAVWGIAYKADTTSTKNSPAVDLIHALRHVPLKAYDPQATLTDAPHCTQVGSALEACSGAAALAIVTPWKAFAQVDPRAIRERLAGRTVIDPYGVLDGARCESAGLDYYRLGCAPRQGNV